MLSYKHLNFLQQKIEGLKSALFFSMNNSVLKFPTSVVSALKVDEVGQVWFFIRKPNQHIAEFDRQFPARLEFYKKGKQYFLKILGKACIVNDPEEMNGLVDLQEGLKENGIADLVLVKVKIEKADYFEYKPAITGMSVADHCKKIVRWLLGEQPGYKPYTFETLAY